MYHLRTVLAVVVFSSFFFFVPAGASAEERIIEFATSITVNADATLDIEETIRYEFDGERHGIYRIIPLLFTDSAGEDHYLDIDLLEVVDENGTSYEVNESIENDDFHLRIGDPYSFVSGQKTYILRYKVAGALIFLEDRDEVYWNATGNEWKFGIASARARVVLPPGIKSQSIFTSCYQGARGDTEACEIEVTGESVVLATATRALMPSEGLTVAVGFPKGIVALSDAAKRAQKIKEILSILEKVFAVLVPLFVGFFAYREWNRNGRDYKGRSVQVREFEPPRDLSIFESAYLLGRSAPAHYISAVVVELARKGALRIVETKVSFLGVFKSTKYNLVKTTDTPADLHPSEAELLALLFDPSAGAVGDTLTLADVKTNVFNIKLVKIEFFARTLLVEKGYFTRDPSKYGGWLLWTAIGVPALGLVCFLLFGAGWLFISTIPSGIICGIFLYLMPQRTKKGAEALDALLGLKSYIGIAEKDRLEFHNAPAKSPEVFERLLPYAMLFGLTEIWVNEFKDLLKTAPEWYSGSGAWNSAVFASQLSSFDTTFTSSATPSSGGSASSGGGSSGGGGGGGGGGSW